MTSARTESSKAACAKSLIVLLLSAFLLAAIIGVISPSSGLSAKTFAGDSLVGFLNLCSKFGVRLHESRKPTANADADSNADTSVGNMRVLSWRRLQARQRFPYDVMTCTMGKPVLKTQRMDTKKYDAVSDSVIKLYDRLPKHCNSTSCPQADWAGCVLRMSGHDFMDFDPIQSLGGSDGCIDFDDPDNKGLEECLYVGEFGTSLHQAYQEHCLDVSLADFLVIGAEAIMSATRPANLPPIDFRSQFRFGRSTVQQCPKLPALPNPENGCDAVEQTFVRQMGLTWRESAALMGVHSLGRAQKKNSGYDGWWSDPENSRSFNNNYYASMLAKGWRARRTPTIGSRAIKEKFTFDDTNPDKIQWARFDHRGNMPESTRHEMMLNTDLCLAFANHHGQPVLASRDECCTWVLLKFNSRRIGRGKFTKIVVNSDGKFCGEPLDFSRFEFENHKACCHNTKWLNCGDQPGGFPRKLGGPAEDDVFEFAANETAWLSTFLTAWRKATLNGQESLQLLHRSEAKCEKWCANFKKEWHCSWKTCSGCPNC
mmetsp:Transcript_130061/g.224719  ORF Transcript_130061/g.224719 Transcript_130061/m.224719 type:complete len:542 (-) Transcript_130061:241-1866(-)